MALQMKIEEKATELKKYFNSLIKQFKKYDKLRHTPGMHINDTINQKMVVFYKEYGQFIRKRKSSCGVFSEEDYVRYHKSKFFEGIQKLSGTSPSRQFFGDESKSSQILSKDDIFEESLEDQVFLDQKEPLLDKKKSDKIQDLFINNPKKNFFSKSASFGDFLYDDLFSSEVMPPVSPKRNTFGQFDSPVLYNLNEVDTLYNPMLNNSISNTSPHEAKPRGYSNLQGHPSAYTPPLQPFNNQYIYSNRPTVVRRGYGKLNPIYDRPLQSAQNNLYSKSNGLYNKFEYVNNLRPTPATAPIDRTSPLGFNMGVYINAGLAQSRSYKKLGQRFMQSEKRVKSPYSSFTTGSIVEKDPARSIRPKVVQSCLEKSKEFFGAPQRTESLQVPKVNPVLLDKCVLTNKRINPFNDNQEHVVVDQLVKEAGYKVPLDNKSKNFLYQISDQVLDRVLSLSTRLAINKGKSRITVEDVKLICNTVLSKEIRE